VRAGAHRVTAPRLDQKGTVCVERELGYMLGSLKVVGRSLIEVTS
jgi:hypothetical protein